MKRILLQAIAATTLLTAHAQGHILRLIPQLQAALGDKMSEQYDAMLETEHPITLILFERIAKNQIQNGLGDSLIAAFERELPLAQESDRYQVNKDGKRMLSYSLAIKGKLGSQENMSHTRQFMNHLFDIHVETAAMLDVEDDSLLTFRYFQTTDQTVKPGYDTQRIDEFLSRVAQMKGVKAVPVEYILTDRKKRPRMAYFNYNGGIGRRTGIRYEVPKELAQKTMQEFKDIARSYFYSEHPVIVRIEQKESHVGFDWKEVRMAEITEDGRLFLLNAKVVDGNMQIPGQWPRITYYNNGVER